MANRKEIKTLNLQQQKQLGFFAWALSLFGNTITESPTKEEGRFGLTANVKELAAMLSCPLAIISVYI